MAYNNRFRRSMFGGFRRKDVLECFEKFSEEKADEVKELTDQIEELRLQLDQKEEQLRLQQETFAEERDALIAEKEEILAEKAQMVAEREQIDEQVNAIKQVMLEQKAQMDGMTLAREQAESESKASRQLLKERDVKIAFLEDKNQKLILKMEGFERKSRKYDALSVEIGEMMLEAKQSAESIIRQAEERSARLAADADHEVERLSADLTQFLQQLNEIESSINSTQSNLSAFRKTVAAPAVTEHSATSAKVAKDATTVTPRAVEKTERKLTAESDGTGRVGKTINRLMELIGRD